MLQRYRLTVKRATTSGEPLSVEKSPLSEAVAESASASQTGAAAAELWSAFEESGAGFGKDDTLLDLDVVVESVPPCAATAAAESDSPPAAVPRARLPSARPDTSFPIASNATPPQRTNTGTGSSGAQAATADASLVGAHLSAATSPPPAPVTAKPMAPIDQQTIDSGQSIANDDMYVSSMLLPARISLTHNQSTIRHN